MSKIRLELRNRKDPITIKFKEGTLFFSKKGLNFEDKDGNFISLSISSKEIKMIEILEDKK